MNTNLPHLRSVRSPSLLACATLLAGFSVSLSAQTFIFQEGLNDYAGTSDTFISTNNVNNNYGAAATIQTRYSSNSSGSAGFDLARERFNTLIRFDDLGITGTVQSASITLTISDINSDSGGSASIQFLAYELKKSWSESQVTWNNAATGSSWAAPGAKDASDRNLTPIFESSVYQINNDSPTLNVDNTITITLPKELVQSWIDDPASNYGILLSVGASSQYRYPYVSFHSSEAADISLRPQLTITGDFAGAQIPEPSSAAALLGLGGLAAAALRRNRRRD